MADYISRKEVLAVFGDIHPLDHNANAYAVQIKRILAADVRPVVRGRWIFDRGDLATCSNCGSEILKRDVRNHKFCHYCGADMRKEE